MKIFPRADRADTHERRDRHAGDQGNSLRNLLAGDIFIRRRGGGCNLGVRRQQRQSDVKNEERWETDFHQRRLADFRRL
jgi:hypothetical protein